LAIVVAHRWRISGKRLPQPKGISSGGTVRFTRLELKLIRKW
jgi:hypothetical protein